MFLLIWRRASAPVALLAISGASHAGLLVVDGNSRVSAFLGRSLASMLRRGFSAIRARSIKLTPRVYTVTIMAARYQMPVPSKGLACCKIGEVFWRPFIRSIGSPPLNLQIPLTFPAR